MDDKAMALGFQNDLWLCRRCGKWTRLKLCHSNGEYIKTCKCGRTTRVTVVMEERIRRVPKITMVYEGYRRCDRGTPKKVIK